jgi:hypothetical protein
VHDVSPSGALERGGCCRELLNLKSSERALALPLKAGLKSAGFCEVDWSLQRLIKNRLELLCRRTKRNWQCNQTWNPSLRWRRLADYLK